VFEHEEESINNEEREREFEGKKPGKRGTREAEKYNFQQNL
jgi:hypothetical protein